MKEKIAAANVMDGSSTQYITQQPGFDAVCEISWVLQAEFLHTGINMTIMTSGQLLCMHS